jgi:hypothetical protein
MADFASKGDDAFLYDARDLGRLLAAFVRDGPTDMRKEGGTTADVDRWPWPERDLKGIASRHTRLGPGYMTGSAGIAATFMRLLEPQWRVDPLPSITAKWEN